MSTEKVVRYTGHGSISRERLLSLLRYDPETGVFTHKQTRNQAKLGTEAGTVESHGYVQIKLDGHIYMAHRLAFLYMNGDFPKYVDHISGERSDNRWSNLREVSHVENMRNKGRQRNNSSGHVGVFKLKTSGLWLAYIYVNKKRVDLGRFDTYGDAVKARKDAEAVYGFHRNHGKRPGVSQDYVPRLARGKSPAKDRHVALAKARGEG